MKKGKILYISQEISPYLPSTNTSETGRKLPQSMHEKGYEVRTFMPRYGMINERRNQLHEVIRLSGMNLVIDDSDHPLIIKVASLMPSRMQVYFIDSEDYFHRSSKGKETEVSPDDNDERTIFFTRGVLETVKRLRWEPALVQCSGWITALVSLYIQHKMSDDPSFRNVKTVYALMNDKFDGVFDQRFVEKLTQDGIPIEALEHIHPDGADYYSLSRLAISSADAIVQAEEEADDQLIDFAVASGKPFLSFPGEDNLIEACAEFYDALINS